MVTLTNLQNLINLRRSVVGGDFVLPDDQDKDKAIFQAIHDLLAAGGGGGGGALHTIDYTITPSDLLNSIVVNVPACRFFVVIYDCSAKLAGNGAASTEVLRSDAAWDNGAFYGVSLSTQNTTNYDIIPSYSWGPALMFPIQMRVRIADVFMQNVPVHVIYST